MVIHDYACSHVIIPPGATAVVAAAALTVAAAIIIIVAAEEIALTSAVDIHARTTAIIAGIWDVKFLLAFCMK